MDGKIREEFLAYLRKLVTSGMLDDGVPEQFNWRKDTWTTYW